MIVVFISNYPNYVFDVFDTEPINFLTKPIKDNQFEQTILKAVDKYRTLHKTITLKEHFNVYNIEIKDICFVEAYNRHLKYHLINGEIIEVVGKIDKAFSDLQLHDFIKTHQGYIVNMHNINRIKEDQIYMKNKEIALISSRKKLEVKKTYYNYLNR